MSCGWLAGPLPFEADGNLVGSEFGAADVAFRFPDSQGVEIRDCDDFKYGLVNLRASDFTPATLPTWDHIGQIDSDLPTALANGHI